MDRRNRVAVIIMAVVLVVTVVATWSRTRTVDPPSACAPAPAGPSLSRPLLSPARMAEQPDPRLDQLVAALEAMPFGPVVAGVGYEFDRWLTLAGLDGPEGGLVAWTKRNATWQVLDATTLEPRWGGTAPTEGMSWDTSGARFYALGAGDQVSVSAYDVGAGTRAWCTTVGRGARNDQLATAVLSRDDLVVATPIGANADLTRLRGVDGGEDWSVGLDHPADSVAALDADHLVAGGLSNYDLYDPQVRERRTEPEVQITGRDATTGEEVWAWTAGEGASAHLVGTVPDSGLTILEVVGSESPQLLALDREGQQVWAVRTRSATPVQAALRSDVVLVRGALADGKPGLAAYDARTGRRWWTREERTSPQYFPYGFDLASVPSLDARHVLLPTTDALVSLDIRTGETISYALPTDGINTTYWPYEVVVTSELIAVVTNTGAVVVRREDLA